MSKPDSSLPAAAPSAAETRQWQQIAAAVEGFAGAWEAQLATPQGEADLAEWLPAEPGLRRRTLAELVKVDLEYRWRSGRGPRKLEEYLAEYAELRTESTTSLPAASLPTGLIYKELQARLQAGDPVTEAELQQRFPEQAGSLSQLLGEEVAGTPTSTYFANTLQRGSSHTDAPSLSPPLPTFQVGTQIDDFQLLTQLGQGAFAQVFLARQVSMERLVALKISAHQGSEPQTLAQLDHGNIVRVFDQRVAAEPEARLLYMEVVPGGTLQEVVPRVRAADKKERNGRLLLEAVDEQLKNRGVSPPTASANRHWMAEAPWPLVVCQLGAQLAEGLAYAHDKGVMHRDIKPANVLLTPEGTPKLADFNVSYNGGRAEENPEDTFGGSLVYMSPEQLQACHPALGGSPELVQGASDVYSLGVMLWELLCGARPFAEQPAAPKEPQDASSELTRVQRMIDQRHYANLSELAEQLPRDCPESLRQVLLHCLQPRQDERYASAAEVGTALRLCLNPATWKLLQPSRHPLAGLVLRFPLLAVVIAGLVPNALAGRFNYVYNQITIIQPLSALTESFAERFHQVQLVVNGLAFPLGVLLALVAACKTIRLLKTEDNPDERALGGRQVLLFGRFVSLFALGMWTVSGLVFPIAIGWGHEVPGALSFYVHFFLSLALCGFAAVAYPYFLITTLATRFFVPALVRNQITPGPRWADLQLLRKLNKVHLVLTALVPMLGMMLISGVGTQQRWALLIASGCGIVGFVAMFVLERYLDRTLDALGRIAVDAPLRMQ
jgi:serine/threonine protein kinase